MAFYGCENLEVIITNNDIHTIGDQAFYNCKKITSIEIGSQKASTIGVQAFYGCTSLYKVVIKDYVETISKYAFQNCTNLTSVTIGQRVKSGQIGYFAFYNCFKLVEVYDFSTAITIYPHSNTNGYVGYYAKSIITDKDADSILVRVDDYLFAIVDGKNYLVNYIGNNTVLSLPESLPEDVFASQDYVIGKYAFYNNDSITSVVMPDNVTFIEDKAFNSCDNLEKIEISDSVKGLGESVFYNCNKLIVEDSGLYYVDKWLVDCKTTVISATIRANTVGIAPRAFYNCSIEKVTIPAGVKFIGKDAFYGCTALVNVYFSNQQGWTNANGEAVVVSNAAANANTLKTGISWTRKDAE
jgi:hypothetical protein